MAKWPNELSTRFLDGVIQERPTKDALRKSYIGLNYFPVRPVMDYELTWDVVKSANRIAGIYAMDGTPVPGDDPAFYERMANVLNIMAARRLEESTVMTFREPGELALKSRVLQGKREKARRMLRSKIASADDEVDATIEYLCMQALQGTITWPPTTESGSAITPAPAYWGNAQPISLDLGFRSAFVQNIATLSGYNGRSGGGHNWKHASADPMLDLFVIAENHAEVGNVSMNGATLIMSTSALTWIATRPNVVQWFVGGPSSTSAGAPATDAGRRFIDYQQLTNYIKTAMGFNVVLYDAKWTYETNVGSESGETENSVRFLPINKMIVIPAGSTGGDMSYFATAPISGPNDAYRTGKQTWSEKMTKPPWSWEIGVQIKGFPILKDSQSIGVYTLW